MLKCFTVLLCFLFFNYGGGEDAFNDREITVEFTLRNLLIVRNAFPKEPKFWQTITSHENDQKKLQAKFWKNLLKKAYNFVRSPIGQVVLTAALLPFPVVGAAVTIGLAVADAVIEHAQRDLNKNRPQPDSQLSPPQPRVAWFCADVGGFWGLKWCDHWVSRIVLTRSKTLALTGKLLNDIADTNRTIRNEINTTLKRMSIFTRYRLKKKKGSLFIEVGAIVSHLIRLSQSLSITAVESPSDR